MGKGKRKGSGPGPWKPAAHHYAEPKPTAAFKLGNRSVYGGPGRVMCRMDWAMLLCCSDIVPSASVYMSPAAQKLMPSSIATTCAPYIRIDWPDQAAPWDLGYDFWAELIVGLKKIGKPGAIGVSCFGGCGRTGTALAIMAQLSGAIPKGECPVAFIRRNYWHDAVESVSQGRYIEQITGAKVTTAIDAWVYGGSSVYSSSSTSSWVNGQKSFGTYANTAYGTAHIGKPSECDHGVLFKDDCSKCNAEQATINDKCSHGVRYTEHCWTCENAIKLASETNDKCAHGILYIEECDKCEAHLESIKAHKESAADAKAWSRGVAVG